MLKWLHEQFCLVAVFIMLIMFSIIVLNIKVVENFHVFLVLKFHDFRPACLGFMPFPSSLSVSVYFMNRSER